MWSGDKPPRMPGKPGDASTPNKKSKNNQQRTPTPKKQTTPQKTFTPSARRSELESLRERGLTTLLNRHFNDTIQQVAAETAAANAALEDLRRRQERAAQTVTPSSNEAHISPLDALYLSVNQWQKECRRKEKETLLLYQRYVDKFGASGQIQVPTAAANGERPEWAKPDAMATSPTSKVIADLPTLNTPVSDAAKQIENLLDQYLKDGAMELPSFESLGKDTTLAQIYKESANEFSKYFQRQLEARGVDAKCTLTEKGVATEPGHLKAFDTNPFLRTVEDKPKLTINTGIDRDLDCIGLPRALPTFVSNDFDADDDRSIVSGLTLNTMETRRILEDCERSVATFLQEEQEAVKEMMNSEEEMLSPSPSSKAKSTIAGADRAETMVEQMKVILKDFESKQPSKDELDDDITHMAQKNCRPVETDNPSEDWVAYYNETYKREYFHERNSNRTQWQAPDILSADSTDDTLSLMDASSIGSMSTYTDNYTSSGRRRVSLYASFRKKKREARRRSRRRYTAGGAVALAALVYFAMKSRILVQFEIVTTCTDPEEDATPSPDMLKHQFLPAPVSIEQESVPEVSIDISKLLAEASAGPSVSLYTEKLQTSEMALDEAETETSQGNEMVFDVLDLVRSTWGSSERGLFDDNNVSLNALALTTQVVNSTLDWVCFVPFTYIFLQHCRGESLLSDVERHITDMAIQ